MRAPLRLVRSALGVLGWDPVRLLQDDVLLRHRTRSDAEVGDELERESLACRLRHLLREREIDMVVDIGAHEGGFARRVRQLGYTGRILSLEPNPASFAVMSRDAAQDHAWEVRQLAAGSEAGILPFHITRDTQLCSVNRPGAGVREFGTMMDVIEVRDVQVVSLDALEADEHFLTARTLLKVDTQGFDHAVLVGAQDCLARVEAVLFEVPLIPIYENAAHYSETFRLLEAKGFGLYAMAPIAREHRNTVVMEADALWLRRR